jgi:hypothetical protein
MLFNLSTKQLNPNLDETHPVVLSCMDQDQNNSWQMNFVLTSIGFFQW